MSPDRKQSTLISKGGLIQLTKSSPRPERSIASNSPPLSQLHSKQSKSSQSTGPPLQPREDQPERSASGPTIVVHHPDIERPQKSFAGELDLTLADNAPRPQPTNEWSSLSQTSSDHEPSSGSATGSGSPISDTEIPEAIEYTLRVTFWKEAVQIANNHGFIKLNDVSGYQALELFGEECVRNECGSSLAGKSLHFRNGDCTIIGDANDTNDKHVYGLSSQEDWKDICTIVKNFFTSKRHLNQHLDITLDYYGLLTRRISDESFATSKRAEIFSLMKNSFDNKRYIPRTDLTRITSADMIRQIVLEDPVPGMSHAEQERFIREVFERARKLLAMCVHAQLQMRCLKVLLDHGHNDSTLASNPLEDEHRCHEKCGPNFEILLQNQGGFSAAEFMRPGEHKRLHRRTVVPIHYHPKEEVEEKKPDEEDTTVTQRAYCGSGAYSNVYRVKIDPAHHRLSKNKNADFAVKIFKDRPQRTELDFKKELKILDELRKYPHDHIVTHHATWTQDDRYYMLFSYAQCNLRQYMKRRNFGEPTKRNILWLLRQFLGLSHALRQIHNLSNTDAVPEGSTNLLAPTANLRKSGWHHDLKPENILYFRDLSPLAGAFQIADFGTGKVHTYRSGSVNTRSPNGTLTYEPPEAVKEGATSRPYDMWSMGCVFLELLIWAAFDYASVKSFTSDRDQRRSPGSQTDIVADDGFWQIDGDSNITLRQSVQSWIEKLRNKLRRQGNQYFEKVLDLVIRMLDTERLTRIPALDLWDTLDRIHKQATVDMEKFKHDSLPAEVDLDFGKSSVALPRLSTNAPDRRTPEPISPTVTNRSDTHTHFD